MHNSEEIDLLLEAEGYESLPVDIDTFLESEEYLGDVTKGGEQIYPMVKKELHRIFPDPIAPSPYFKVFLKGCFTGGTRIPLLDGSERSLEELECNYKDKSFWVYSRDPDGTIVPGLAHSPRITKYVNELIEIVLDNGNIERCTLDHPFMLRDGTYKEAQYLQPGDSLMPLYRKVSTVEDDNRLVGYEMIQQIIGWEFTHHVVVPSLPHGYVRHHKDFNKLNNCPENLEVLSTSEHARVHSSTSLLKRWYDPMLRSDASERARENMQKLNSNKEFVEKCKAGIHSSDKFKESNRRKILQYNKSNKGREESRRRAAHMRELLEGKSEEEKVVINLKRSLASIRYHCATYCKNVPWNCPKHKAVYEERLASIRKKDPSYLLDNHKVKSSKIVRLKKSIPMYDISVNTYHNFALSSGVFVHNSIGWGKTTMAKIAQAYNIYRLTLMRDPHEFYGLLNTTHIAFLCFSATLDLAGETYDEFLDMIGGSPYFKSIAHTNDKEGRLVEFPKKIIVKPASTVTHTLGAAVLGGILDEMNFHRAGVKGTYKAYTSVLRRMGSRFEKDGYVAGQLYAISSETDISSFMEKTVSEWRGKPGVLVMAHSVYSTGKRKYKERFKVFVGDGIVPPRVLDEREKVTPEVENYVIEVPMVYKPDFIANIYDSLQDISGIPATAHRKFYPTRKAILDVAVLPNIFYGDTITLPFKGEESMLDHCDLNLLGKLDKSKLRNIHIDIASSGTGDRLGFASSYFRGYKNVTRTRIETGETYITSEPFMVSDMVVGVEAISGYEIPLFKITDFIVALINHGYSIHEVTADGYQSTYLLQIMKRKGLKSRVISCDRTDYAPVTLKHSILEKRCVLVNNGVMIYELSELLRENNKIDHPEGGSKDVADGVEGSVVGAVENIQNIPVALQSARETYEKQGANVYDQLRSLGGKVYHGGV